MSTAMNEGSVRTLPRASNPERVAWGILLVGLLAVLATATQLTPDPRGMGTHEQIVLFGKHVPPCSFRAKTGIPCPSCGFTTTFALAAHGRLVQAIANQPFGFLLFVVFCLLVPTAIVAALGGVSVARACEGWPWKWILAILAVLWLAAWIYKIEVPAWS